MSALGSPPAPLSAPVAWWCASDGNQLPEFISNCLCSGSTRRERGADLVMRGSEDDAASLIDEPISVTVSDGSHQ